MLLVLRCINRPPPASLKHPPTCLCPPLRPAAGALTGTLFRSVRGPRQAVVAGGLGAVGGGLLLAARRYINKGL